MDRDDVLRSKRGAPAAYRGYRLQALYTLKRLLTPGVREDCAVQLEGREDLAIIEVASECVREVVQVKSYSTLALSHLSPQDAGSFLHRSVELLQAHTPPQIKLVNFGTIGPEISQAWRGEATQRRQVFEKLLSLGFTADNVERIFERVQIEQLDETQERTSVLALLQEMLTGVDPAAAFELMIAWLYAAAEQREMVTRESLIEKINRIGRFLAKRYAYHSEWFTSITPIEDQPVADDRLAQLREEFYQGVSARYEHILAGLDFVRSDKLDEIAKAFQTSNLVIVRGASGQGKTTLAYRYLHDHYPGTWRYRVELIKDEEHALRIARALAGHAQALAVPMAVYVDVRPRDLQWPEFVRRLAQIPYLRVLVTIREEDFRRASVSGAEVDFRSIEMHFDAAEARAIYEAAAAAGHASGFLNFDETWSRFGGSGPLMEFVYLLTQTSALRERLREQCERLQDDARQGALDPAELSLLRLVAVASSYEARLVAVDLAQHLGLREPTRSLHLLEEEYLLRVTPDKRYVTGLHAIRSRILVDLLIDPGLAPWHAIAADALQLMPEEDLESFLLNALVERPHERESIIQMAKDLVPTTWSGLGGVLRVLLWLSAYEYVAASRNVIEIAHKEFGSAWSIIVDLDVAGIGEAARDNLWSLMKTMVSPERWQLVEAIQTQQPPKSHVFDMVDSWLSQLTAPLVPPSSWTEWAGAAEVCYWAGHRGVASQIVECLSESDLCRAAKDLSLTILADVSLALHECDTGRHRDWLQSNRPLIESRLAHEYGIVSLQDNQGTLVTHFLPLYSGASPRRQDVTDVAASDLDSKDSLHQQTVERIELVRNLFPGHDAYGSYGHGYRLGSLESPLDQSTIKSGIPVSSLPPAPLVRLNSIAQGLGELKYRPDAWAEYVEQTVSMRDLVCDTLAQLQDGLARYLRSREALGLANEPTWAFCLDAHGVTGDPPLLPRSAVDPWGFMQEWSTVDLEQAPQRRILRLSAVALHKYQPYLSATREYTLALSNFFWQARHVMRVNLLAGKMPPNEPRRTAILDALRQQGIKTDLAGLSIYNLTAAKSALAEYQSRFRDIFGHLIADDEMADLEARERDVIAGLWQMWYYYATEPHQTYAVPVPQISARIRLAKHDLEQRVRHALDAFTTTGSSASIVECRCVWTGKPALCVRLDIDDPTQVYVKFEDLLAVLRNALADVQVASLQSYLLEDMWRTVVIIPIVRGAVLDRSAWCLNIAANILGKGEATRYVWSLVPQPIPPTIWKELVLVEWHNRRISPAQELTQKVAQLSLLMAHLSDLRDLPDLSESGWEVVQNYLAGQSATLNPILQGVFDTLKSMLDEYTRLAPGEQEARTDLGQAISAVVELHPLVRPSAEFDGSQVLTLDDFVDYAGRLEKARELAEAVRLYWIKDALDHPELVSE